MVVIQLYRNIRGSRYLQQKISNKQIVEVFCFCIHLIQDKHIEANNIITELEVDFMFKALAEDMTEFESNIASILGSTTKLDHYWGTCAYLPYAVKDGKDRLKIRVRIQYI